MDVKWIKITTDMFDHCKIKYLRRLPEGNSIVLIWVMLLTMAGRCNDNGRIWLTENIPYTPKLLADELDFEESTVVLSLEALSRLNMIRTEQDHVIAIAGWEEHQNAAGLEKIRNQTRKRVANHREKQKLLDEECNVTCNVTVTQCNATDIEKEKEEEKNKNLKNKKMRQENLPLESLSSQTLSSHEEQARERRTYGEYHNVILDDEQYDKLSKEFPEDLKERIENLSTYLETTGKEYNSHYAVIRFWAKKEAKKAKKASYKPPAAPKDSRIFRGEQKPVTDDEYDLLVL